MKAILLVLTFLFPMLVWAQSTVTVPLAWDKNAEDTGQISYRLDRSDNNQDYVEVVRGTASAFTEFTYPHPVTGEDVQAIRYDETVSVPGVYTWRVWACLANSSPDVCSEDSTNPVTYVARPSPVRNVRILNP